MANDTTHGDELWRTDGTASGTTLVKDITPGMSSTSIYNFTAFGNALFFMVRNDTSGGYVLWKTNGTEVGTVLLVSIVPSIGGNGPNNFMAVGNRLYFVANDGTHGDEVWASDGTAAGTGMLKDINPGLGDGYSSSYGVLDFIAAGNLLYFKAYEPTTGYEIWKTDGSFAGTVRVTDLNPGVADGVGGIIQ